MKRLSLLIASVWLCLLPAAAQNSGALETSVYNELNSAAASEFYPGVVEKAIQLEKKYPHSSLLNDALCKKGEALFYMEQYDSAIYELEKLLPVLEEKSELKIKAEFFLAQSYDAKLEFDSAIKNYLRCAEHSKNVIDKYFNQSVYKAGKLFFTIGEYKNAITNFEYVVQNGKKFSAAEYSESVQKLLVSYNNINEFQKTVQVFNQLPEEKFEPEIFYTLCMYNADALKAINQNIDSYENYCRVIESGYPDLAVVALKKAYVLAGEKRIGVNPAEVFSKATKTFSNEPGLVREFWIRLGIDEYNKNNFKASEKYFENAAAVEGDSSKESAVITLYKSKILIDGAKQYEEAEKNLEENNQLLLQDKYSVNDSWYSALLSCKVNLKKWNEIEACFNKIKNPSVADKYNLASCYYHENNFKNVITILKAVCEPDVKLKYPLCARLYASALARDNQISKASQVYNKLYSAGVLSSLDKLEFSKVLFISKVYRQAVNIAHESETTEGLYVAGLCNINLKNWKDAKADFVAYIKDKNKVSDFKILSYFYKGYCEYSLEDFRNAYVSFVRFTNDGKDSDYKYITSAYDLASKAALQYGDYNQAATQIESLIKICKTDKEKQNAVIYLCDIYCDSQKYSKAINLLEPYLSVKNNFTVTALFKEAQVYEHQKNLDNADKIYEKIYTEYPKDEVAQDAMYRSAELFYSYEDYASSQRRFNKYIYKYIDGKYFDAALFFCADCDLKLGRFDESIMLNNNLLSKYPDCSYVYGANKNLLTAYYEQENFIKALESAKILVAGFPEQSALDGIGSRLIQLEKIVSGTDRSVAEKISEYEKAGKAGTYEGRKTGTELVQLYAQNENLMDDAVILAQEILNNHKEDSKEEFMIAAQNAEFLGDYCSNNLKNKEAGSFYLEAARYYRGCQKEDKAATCLYSAADAFVSEGQNGDAKEVVELLKSLYPDSKQAKAAVRLVK